MKIQKRKIVPKKKKPAYKPAALTVEEFLREVRAVREDIASLKEEMTARFEKHENIILAEYRHRIEDLEGKVRMMEAVIKK